MNTNPQIYIEITQIAPTSEIMLMEKDLSEWWWLGLSKALANM